jgi:hypothetical protein
MPKVAAPKPTIPWQPGGKANPSAPQPDGAKGPFIFDYRGPDGKSARIVGEWTDSESVPDDIEIQWEDIYRWVPISAVP